MWYNMYEVKNLMKGLDECECEFYGSDRVSVVEIGL